MSESKGDKTATGIECPYCGMGVGEFCRTSSGWISPRTHVDRIKAWVQETHRLSSQPSGVTKAWITPASAQDNVREMLEAVITDGIVYHIHSGHDTSYADDPVAVVVPFAKYQALRAAEKALG